MIWKPIPGYPRYEVSDTGKVFDIHTQELVKPKLNNCGYLRVGTRKNRVFVHRLVALAFIPNPLNKPCVNHIDGVKTNNHVSNLEWVTYSENINHAYKNGLEKKIFGKDHPQYGKVGSMSKSSKLTDEQRLMIPELIKSGKSMAQIAREWGVSRGCIKKTNQKLKNIKYVKHLNLKNHENL